MKTVLVDSLVPGYVFSAPLFIDSENIFTAANSAIAEEEINKLKEWGVKELQTEGELVAGPGVVTDTAKPGGSGGGVAGGANSGAAGGAAGGNTEAAAVKARDKPPVVFNQLMTIIQELNAVFLKIESKAYVDSRFLSIISGNLLRIIQSSPQYVTAFVLNGTFPGFALAKNAVVTAILSVLIFREIVTVELLDPDLLMSALLHDAGKLRLPRSVTEKNGRLSAIETELMCAHVVYGYQIARQELRCSENICINILQHHEHFDGTGYTQALHTNQITVGAKIISAADAFDAMISKKPYRNSMSGYEAMKNLMSDNSHRYDPDVLKAFVKIMGVYPVGQNVVLNNGAVAKVIEASQSAPLRPQLVVITPDDEGTLSAGQRIDLLKQSGLFILRANS